MDRLKIARIVREMLDAKGAQQITIELDAGAARQLIRDLEIADYACGSSDAYSATRVRGSA